MKTKENLQSSHCRESVETVVATARRIEASGCRDFEDVLAVEQPLEIHVSVQASSGD